jgi:DHA1 family multidrug resistance protein-like MFS transporter
MLNLNSAQKRVLPIGLSVALALFGDLSLFTVLVTQLEVTQLTLAQVGILLSIHRFIRIPFNPLVGLLQDRLGRRILFITGLALAVVSTFLYGVSVGFFPFLFSRILWGTAWALINVGGMTMTLDLCTPSNRGRLTGIYNTFIWLGFAVGPALGGRLTDTIGFRSAMLICAAIAAIALFITVFFVSETRPQSSLASPSRITFSAYLERLNPFNGNREIMKAQILLAVFMFAGDGVVLSTLTLLLRERLGGLVPFMGSLVGIATFSGALFAMRSVAAALISPLAGRLADQFGKKPVLAGFFLLGIASYLMIGFSRTQPGLAFSAILTAFSGGAVMVLLMALIGDHAHDSTGAAMGKFAMMGDLGSSIGPALALVLIPLIGISQVYSISAFLFLLCTLFLLIPLQSRTADPARE